MATAVASRGGRPEVYSEDALLKAVRRFKRTVGHVPRVEDLGPNRPDGYPSAGTLIRRFGSFAAAIEQAGFERPRRGPRPQKASRGRRSR